MSTAENAPSARAVFVVMLMLAVDAVILVCFVREWVAPIVAIAAASYLGVHAMMWKDMVQMDQQAGGCTHRVLAVLCTAVSILHSVVQSSSAIPATVAIINVASLALWVGRVPRPVA